MVPAVIHVLIDVSRGYEKRCIRLFQGYRYEGGRMERGSHWYY